MTKPVNILFISLPTIPFEDIKRSFSGENERPFTLVLPLGVLWLSSYLKKENGHVATHLIDYAHDLYRYADELSTLDELIMHQVDKVPFEPDILAFSVMFSASHPFLELAIDRLSARWPTAKVVVGGNHATNATQLLLDNPRVDYVARGEGEISFSEFVGHFDKLPDHRIKGIYSKSEFAETASPTIGNYVENLDDIPFPEWDLLDMDIYTRSKWGRASKNVIGQEDRRVASILTTRGCPFSCTFCASHTVAGRKVRFRSVENVMAEVDALHRKYGVNVFTPEDDLFTANRKKVVVLLKALKERKEKVPGFEIQFPNGLSVNTLFDEVMDALIDAGMKVTTVAIESGSNHVQRNIIKKNCNLKRAKEVVKYLRERSVTTRCFFILGFPGETKTMMRETVDFAKEIQCDWAQISIAAPLRGTEMYQQFSKAGYINDDVSTWGKAFFHERDFDTSEITAAELKEFAYRANLEVNFFNNPNFLSGNYEKAISLFKEVLASFPFHIIAWYCMIKCYEAMGDEAEAAKVGKRIDALIDENELSRQMYLKYGALMEDYSPPPHLGLQCDESIAGSLDTLADTAEAVVRLNPSPMGKKGRNSYPNNSGRLIS